MDLDKAWEEFQKRTAIKKSGLAEKIDTLAAQLNEIQTDTKRMAEIVPKIMGDNASIDAANEEASMNVPPMNMDGAMGAEGMPGGMPGGPEGGLDMENEEENAAPLEDEMPEGDVAEEPIEDEDLEGSDLEEPDDEGGDEIMPTEGSEEDLGEGLEGDLGEDLGEGLEGDEGAPEEDLGEAPAEEPTGDMGGGAVEKLKNILKEAVDSGNMHLVSEIASVIEEIDGSGAEDSLGTPADASGDMSAEETELDSLDSLEDDDDDDDYVFDDDLFGDYDDENSRFAESAGESVDDALSDEAGEKIASSDTEDAIVERIMSKLRGIIEEELGIGASDEQLGEAPTEDAPLEAEIEIEAAPEGDESEPENTDEDEESDEGEECEECDRDEGKSTEDNKAIADEPIEECDDVKKSIFGRDRDFRDLYESKIAQRHGVDGMPFRKAKDILDTLRTPGSKNAGASIDKEGKLGELGSGSKGSSEHRVEKNKDLIDNVDEKKGSSDNRVNNRKEPLNDVNEQKSGSDHKVNTDNLPLKGTNKKKNMTEHTVNNRKSPIDNVKGVQSTTKTIKSAGRPPASATANGDIVRPVLGEFKKSSSMEIRTEMQKMEDLRSEIRQDWADYYDNVARKGLVYR